MKDDIKRRFPNLTPLQEEMKKRAIKAEQDLYEAMRQKATAASSPLSNPAGSVSGFAVSVSNNVVKDAKVVVGWNEGITYVNENKESITISSAEADILISQTDANGIALFPRISPQWIIEDYTGYFNSTEDGPIKLYAPIYTYGGSQDTGYDPIPMMSNFSMRNVNPITTIFTSTIPNRSLQEVDPEELLTTIEYLKEWTGKDTVTEEEIEEITTGRVKPDFYSDLIDPIKKAKDLFQGLDIADSKIEIEVAGDTPSSTIAEISISSYYAAEISGLYKFNTYVADRKKGVKKSNRIDYTSDSGSNGYISKERAGQLLGYSITSDTPVTEIVKKLYDKQSTKDTFVSIKTTYSEDLTKDDNGGGNPQNGILYINSATANTGDALVYGSDSVVDSGGEKLCTVEVITADGVKKQFENVTLTTVSEDAGAKKYVYSLNLYDAVGLVGPVVNTQFKIQAETTSNRTQITNSVIIKQDEKGNYGIFDLLLGTLLPEVAGKGDPGDTGSISLIITSDPGTKVAQSALLTQGEGLIGGKGFAEAVLSGKTLYIYWNGERWVVDNDTDAKFVVALGSSNGDTLVGDYEDSQVKGRLLYTITSSEAPPKAP